MKSLLIGSGNSTKKQIVHGVTPDREFTDLTTLDLYSADVIHDLNVLPYPFEDDSFDEIHAYEVLEHCGSQGDVNFFFAQFNEFHRILSGVMLFSVPNYKSVWAFGDPGHKRVLPPTVFNFLSKSFYKQVGETACADYRHLIEGYWDCIGVDEGETVFIILQRV